ncbi:hypothetical protein [Chryseobacterium lathyri]|jgi:hypothetical protein|uniref:Uncharacterized protein n=1 Tax=Chryseobacterium lathyri TaxID=395933 RepID=A0A511Y8B5_9FLAO|nr:hypothetical protein [Chryseobacterium lathyri]GEN71442.1 hypothetical protein CLA01_15140 [Chryseobacterium lathyri]
MKNYKNTGWIKEMQDQPDEKSGKGLYNGRFVFLLFGNPNLTSFKENEISDNPRQEM